MSEKFQRKERIIMSVILIFLNFYRNLKFIIVKIFNRELRVELKKNDNDCFNDNLNSKSDLCFVLGNGPSLKKINHDKLINQDVFAVNFFFNNDWFKKLKSVNYFFTDPAIFGDCNKQKLSEIAINDIAKLLDNKSVKRIIIPYQRKKQWLRIFGGVSGMDKMRYYYSNNEFVFNNLKFLKPSDNFYKGQTVVINALLYAMALGYKKIYLLGIDLTGFLEKYELNSNFQEHSYRKSKSQIVHIDMSSEDNEFNLKIHGKMFEQFKYVKKIAEKNNIKIFNATPGGALDVFERINFEKLI